MLLCSCLVPPFTGDPIAMYSYFIQIIPNIEFFATTICLWLQIVSQSHKFHTAAMTVMWHILSQTKQLNGNFYKLQTLPSRTMRFMIWVGISHDESNKNKWSPLNILVENVDLHMSKQWLIGVSMCRRYFVPSRRCGGKRMDLRYM